MTEAQREAHKLLSEAYTILEKERNEISGEFWMDKRYQLLADTMWHVLSARCNISTQKVLEREAA